MGIPLSTSAANIYNEYAATHVTRSTSMPLDANGHLNPVINVTINYARTDYVVDAAGNKLNVIQRNQPLAPAPGLPWTPDPYTGSVSLTPAQVATLTNGIPSPAQEDAFIEADLVVRGIMPAPTTA